MPQNRRLSTGSAVATSAGNLHAKYVFHAVRPRYSGSKEDERLLASAYKCCLDLAEQYSVQSIAFHSISTGVYGYNLNMDDTIALRTIVQHIQKPTSLKQVLVVLYGDQAYQAYERAMSDVVNQ